MKWISVTYRSRAPSKKVWRAWTMQNPELKKKQENHKYIYHGQNKKLAYKICDVVQGKGFSTLWKTAPFLHFLFRYEVEESGKGSLITFSARLKGFYAPLVQFFIKKKVNQNLENSLKQFIDQVELMP